MRRYQQQALGILAIALGLSVLLHLQAYEGLGVISELMREQDRAARQRSHAAAPTFLELSPLPPEAPAPVEPDDATSREPSDEAPDPEAERPPEREQETARPTPVEPEPDPEPQVTPPVPQPEPERQPEPEPEVTPPPPRPRPNQQAIEQRSDDPDVPPPDDARFLAAENRRVEQETVARETNYLEDQADPQAASQQEPLAESTPDEGSGAEDRVADLRDLEGSEARTATVEEARRSPPRTPTEAAPAASRLPNDTRGGEARGAERGSRGASAPGARASADEVEQVTITDGAGTFTIARPRSAARSGANGEDGRARETARGPGESARPRRGDPAASGEHGPNLRLGYAQFEQVMGEETLRAERDARYAERQSSTRGMSRAERWQQFRSAIENFVPSVRPGEQTALNAAQSPFASYLAAMHRRIHRQFADRFLASRSQLRAPYANREIFALLEIVLNADGSVYRVGVVQTSGDITYDHGAFSSVMQAQPYGASPDAIRSADGRVYLHWGFASGPTQCNPINARPYVLPHPPDVPPMPGARDAVAPARGSVIPADYDAGDFGEEPAPRRSGASRPVDDEPPARRTGTGGGDVERMGAGSAGADGVPSALPRLPASRRAGSTAAP